MENTKDLVRAERSSRFVCQVGGDACSCPAPGTPQLRDPPLAGLFLHPTPPPSPELPSPCWPLNVQGVPLPPQPLTWGFSLLFWEGKKKEREESFSLPLPNPVLAEEKDWIGDFFLF